MGTSHSPGGDAHDPSGQNISDLVEQAAVDGQGLGVTCVDCDDACAGVDRCQRLTPGTGLDDGAHPQGVDPLDEPFEYQSLKTRIEHEQVGPVRPGLVNLIGGDHKVIGKDGKVHRGPDGIQVLEGTSRCARTGHHRHAGGPSGGVEAGQPPGVSDTAEIGEGGGGALDLRDDRHRSIIGTQAGHGADGTGSMARDLPQTSQRDTRGATVRGRPGVGHLRLERGHHTPPRCHLRALLKDTCPHHRDGPRPSVANR